MALWTGLSQAATVAQLVGADVGGLISMIMQAALRARQNRKECEQVARRVLIIAELLPHLQAYPEAVRPLAGLGDTLRQAHELVVSCQGRNLAYQLAMAGRQADRFREVQGRMDSYLILFPMISHIGITRRLDRICNILVPDSARSSPSHFSTSPQVQEPAQVAREVLPHGREEFTLAEIMAATNNFALDAKIGEGCFGLADGRKVATKCVRHRSVSSDIIEVQFRTELAILSLLRHKKIIRLTELEHVLGLPVHGETRARGQPAPPTTLVLGRGSVEEDAHRCAPGQPAPPTSPATPRRAASHPPRDQVVEHPS